MSDLPAEVWDPVDVGSSSAYVIRLGTVYLVVDHGASQTVEYADQLVKALRQDSRVITAHVGALDREWSYQFTAYLPMRKSDDEDGVINGTRHFHGQRFSEPISFELRIPAKNQPKVFEDDYIPSERYFALWDGQCLMVAWEQSVDAGVGSSGGHVVEDVLQKAVDVIDLDLYVQACNPQCKYVFLHTAIRATVDQDAPTDWTLSRRTNDPYLLDVELWDGGSIEEVAQAIWWRTNSSLHDFASMKNKGRQILELEAVVRADLDRLNRLHHEKASASQRAFPARIKAYWTHRAWRRDSRFYLARLWLALGSLERLRRLWGRDATSFRRGADEQDLVALFTVDTSDEVTFVEKLDLRLVEASVEHAEDRLSSNTLALATIGGGVAGALAAAVLTAV